MPSVDQHVSTADERIARQRLLNDAAEVMSTVRIIHVSDLERVTAVLIRQFSGRTDLALHWIRVQQLRHWKWRPGLAVLVREADLNAWCHELVKHVLVKRCLGSDAAALSGTVREFLVESLLAERVREFAAMGMVVPSGYLVDSFLRMLRLLPENPVTRGRINSLTGSVSSCKKWSSRFRSTWQLQWGSTSVPHGVSASAAERRTVVFLRWLRYWFEQLPASKLVVVNMDETMLGSIKEMKVGVVDARPDRHDGRACLPARAGGLPRTSLAASVCSDNAVQQVLPQIRLPSSKHGRCPSKRALDTYADAGVPVITWHGSAGWVTAQILQWYLLKLAAAVRSVRPDAAILLVWDCCPVHLSARVLQTARRCRINIVFVPGRMTWALQPLDTHVFAVLKQTIRKKEFAAKAETRCNRLPCGLRVRLHGAAIREVLVQRSWATVMQRAGLVSSGVALRASVTKLVGSQQVSAAFPSVSDFMEIFAVEQPRAAELMLLLQPSSAPVAAAASARQAAASSQTHSQDDARERAAWSPRPVILSARLPSGPRRAEQPLNVWLPSFAGRSVQTRSMTAAAEASQGAACSSAPASSSKPKRARTRDA